MAPVTHQQKKLLKQLSDELTIGDVGSMKFVCRGKLGSALLERVPNDKPYELFRLLEEKGLISSGDLSCLGEIFKRIQRHDLASKITFSREGRDAVDSGRPVTPLSPSFPGGISPYRVLLKELAEELTSNQVGEIKFLLDIPGGVAARIQDGESILVYMEESGKLKETKFDVLKDVLNDIHRQDMINKIDTFLQGGRAQGCNVPQQVSSAMLMRPRDFQTASSSTVEESFPCYPMNHPPGYALIINIENFSGKTREGLVLNTRKGTKVDLDNLTNLWRKLGFAIEAHSDLKAHQILSVVQDLAGKIDESASCLVCCIMTHGTLGDIYGADSNTVGIGSIASFFKEDKCRALAGKPKLFFIQACRGQNKLKSTSRHVGQPESQLHPDATPAEDANQDDAFRHNVGANESHFMIGYATAPGFVSWRSTQHGSWYISALVEVFSKHFQQEDVLSMMIRVNAKVDEVFTNQGYKQCPAPVITLTKRIYFSSSPTA